MPAVTWFRVARIGAVGLVIAGFVCPWPARADTTLAPEVDLYLTHNPMFRSRLITSANWSDTSGKWSSGQLEYTVDFGLLSFFRRYVYRDPNTEKSKFLNVRLGYGYLPDLNNDDAGHDEQRGVAELTARFPIGGQSLVTDRNKADLRWIDGDYSTRYRNRLRFERGLVVWGVRNTPYCSAEGFYDTNGDRWNRFEARVGAEFPWRQSTVLEFYYAHQAIYQASPVEIVGFIFQKHMVMPAGGSQ